MPVTSSAKTRFALLPGHDDSRDKCRFYWLHYVTYFAAVFLFAMLTTCTRRFISASGLAGSLSLLLP